MVSGNDSGLLDKLRHGDNENKLIVIVDNDIVWVEDKETGEIVGEFDEYGERFIVTLFKYMGIDADEV
jgi:hypothetical protein